MHKNIGYHTRLVADHQTKVCGGSFGGSLDLATANRLVAAHFTCAVKPSGQVVFVDRSGRVVSLYITVDPEATVAGQQAKQEWLKEERKRQEAEAAQEAARQAEIEDAMEGLTHEEIMRRLKPCQAQTPKEAE